MEKLLGVWKMRCYLTIGENGIEEVPVDDPEFERMRIIFKENGVVYEAIESPGKLSKKDKEYMAKQGYVLDGNYILMKEKKWKEENGRLYSEVSSQIKSDTELKEMGEMSFIGDYLKIWALFTSALLEKVE